MSVLLQQIKDEIQKLQGDKPLLIMGFVLNHEQQYEILAPNAAPNYKLAA